MAKRTTAKRTAKKPEKTDPTFVFHILNMVEEANLGSTHQKIVCISTIKRLVQTGFVHAEDVPSLVPPGLLQVGARDPFFQAYLNADSGESE